MLCSSSLPPPPKLSLLFGIKTLFEVNQIFSINSSNTLDQALNADKDLIPQGCICPLVIPMPSAFAEEFGISLHSTFEGVSCFTANVFHSHQQHPTYWRSREGRYVFPW